MSRLVDVLEGEIRARQDTIVLLSAELEDLEQMLDRARLLGQATALQALPPVEVAVEPAAVPEPPRQLLAPPAPRRPRGPSPKKPSPKTDAALVGIRALGDCTIPELAEHLGEENVKALTARVAELRKADLVEGFGPGRAGRRFRLAPATTSPTVADPPPEKRAATPPPLSKRTARALEAEKAVAETAAEVPRIEADLIAALATGPAGAFALAHKLKVDPDDVHMALDRLVATGDLARRANPSHEIGAESRLYELPVAAAA